MPEGGQRSYGLTPSLAGTGSHAPTGATGNWGFMLLSDYGLYIFSRHHTAHLNVFKQAPAVTTSHSGKPEPKFTLPVRAAPQGRRRRLSAVPPCPLSP